MAMSIPSLVVLKNITDVLKQQNITNNRIACLGYPDILAHTEHIKTIFGESIAANLQYHPDSESIIRWHGVGRLTDRIVEAKHFFGLLGYELEIFDIVKARGDEIVLDLNVPMPKKYKYQYVIAIDGGTCEHCFNIAQAVKNFAEMVMKDGFIMQGNPFNMYNHGFYNLNPTWYCDFYLENGFEIHDLKIVHNGVFNPQYFDAPAYQRFKDIPENSSIAMIARRKEIKPIKWPIQTKYKNNPTLKG
jgi:hypothetical protein